MASHDNQQQQLIRQITEQLQALEPSQLKTVEHAIASLKGTGERGLHYFGRFLGIRWGENGEVYMDLGSQNANTYGVAQGGAVYSLADIAIGYLILRDLPPEQQVYTLEMKVNYTKKGQGPWLQAKPQILHKGNYTVVADCRIEDEQGDLVAHAVGTFFLAKVK
jgi:uncharacterized protein (TIGR00369 family)